MDGEIDLGAFFITGIDGVKLSDKEKRALSEIRPLGICLFAENFQFGVEYKEWLSLYKDLLAEVREYSGRDTLLISIDHEGGRVIRPPAPITHFPYPYYWGDKVSEISLAMSLELKSLGINLSFSPSLDIHSFPDNPVIGPRAFAQTPQEVAQAGKIMCSVLKDQGILSCVKHFPGHGDTSLDSHYAVPVLEHDMKRLEEVELAPFQQLIHQGIPMVMTSHVVAKTMDNFPTTESHKIITGLLRQKLGFDGVVITDSVHMKAVKEGFSGEAPALLRSLEAGVDIILVASNGSGDLNMTQNLYTQLRKSLQRGEIEKDILLSSQKRSIHLLTQALNYSPYCLSDAQFAPHRELARATSPSRGEYNKEFSRTPFSPLCRGGEYSPV